MAIIGWPELILVLVILVFLFGATRIKDLVKGVGEGVREFKSATAEETGAQPTRTVNEDPVVEAAKKMGINVEGKSVSQIMDEMAKKVNGQK